MDGTEIEEIVSCKEISVSKLYTVPKRIFDIIVGLVGCILLIPLIIGIKIANLINHDKAPILFKQERIGRNGKPIYIYKFRSMVENADEILFKMLEENEEMRLEYKRYKKLKNDPRITKVGKFIRDTSIDEFPQFINVLIGNMTLVGPRPYLPREIDDMGEYYNYIIKCTPGITGPWQISGRSNTNFEDRLKIDKEYYENLSLKNDALILFKTVKNILNKTGAL